jgi:hypothetical protein
MNTNEHGFKRVGGSGFGQPDAPLFIHLLVCGLKTDLQFIRVNLCSSVIKT